MDIDLMPVAYIHDLTSCNGYPVKVVKSVPLLVKCGRYTKLTVIQNSTINAFQI
jgi:hypothetical protein